MGRSKVRSVVYHATDASFDTFDIDRSDLGAHFGTLEQMRHLESRVGLHGGAMVVMPVWLRMQSPLRLKDVGSFHADAIAVQLEKKGLLPKGTGQRIAKICDDDWRQRAVQNLIVRQAIQDGGYDGVVYRNTQEGDFDSYIALDTRQIKSALGNSGLFAKDSASLTDCVEHFHAEQRRRASLAFQAIRSVSACQEMVVHP